MGFEGGGDLRDLRPIDPDGEARGCHRGAYEALNVRNAQPGKVYYYERLHPGRVLRRLNEGWEAVQADDPEDWGAALPPGIGAALDSSRAFGDVILMRIDEERYRELKERQELLARASREGGPTDTYLNKGQQRASQLGAAQPQDDLYYRRSIHTTRHSDEET